MRSTGDEGGAGGKWGKDNVTTLLFWKNSLSLQSFEQEQICKFVAKIWS